MLTMFLWFVLFVQESMRVRAVPVPDDAESWFTRLVTTDVPGGSSLEMVKEMRNDPEMDLEQCLPAFENLRDLLVKLADVLRVKDKVTPNVSTTELFYRIREFFMLPGGDIYEELAVAALEGVSRKWDELSANGHASTRPKLVFSQGNTEAFYSAETRTITVNTNILISVDKLWQLLAHEFFHFKFDRLFPERQVSRIRNDMIINMINEGGAEYWAKTVAFPSVQSRVNFLERVLLRSTMLTTPGNSSFRDVLTNRAALTLWTQIAALTDPLHPKLLGRTYCQVRSVYGEDRMGAKTLFHHFLRQEASWPNPDTPVEIYVMGQLLYHWVGNSNSFVGYGGRSFCGVRKPSNSFVECHDRCRTWSPALQNVTQRL